jgi:hypothetical protein
MTSLSESFGKGVGSTLRLYGADSTATAYVVTAGLQATLPSGFIDVRSHIGIGPIVPVGTGASGSTFQFRMFGAWAVNPGSTSGAANQWFVQQIAQVNATLGNTVGGSGLVLSASHRFAWSQSVTAAAIATAYTNATYSVGNGANADGEVSIGVVKDLVQPQAIGFDFDIDAGGGTAATAANILLGLFT